MSCFPSSRVPVWYNTARGLRCPGTTNSTTTSSPGGKRKSLGGAFAYRTCCPEIVLKNSGHGKVVDRIICVWFRGPIISPFFGFQKPPLRLIFIRVRFKAADFDHVAKINLVRVNRNRLLVRNQMRRWCSGRLFVCWGRSAVRSLD